MPSVAHERWREFAGDPEDLLRRFEAACDAQDPDPGALSRAVIVSLAAAWESYVEELARETAARRCAAGLVGRSHLIQVRRNADRLNTPTVANVGPLLCDALGANPWVGVTAEGVSEAATRRLINRNQMTRHQIAHGVQRFPVNRSRLVARVRQFEQIVGSLERRACSVLRAQLGQDPW